MHGGKPVEKKTIIDSKEDYTITGYVNTNSGILNVRSDSDVNSAVLGKLPRGTEIIITGERKNGFYPIKFNNMTAWVSADWISFDKPVDNNESFFNSSSETNKDTVVDRKESEENSIENTNEEAGTILISNEKQGLYVKTKDGALKINIIQPENSKRMNVCDFLRGNKLEVGKKFE